MSRRSAIRQSDSLPVLASDNGLERQDGRLALTPPQFALARALALLPEHPRQLREKNMVSQIIGALDLMPPTAMIALADLITQLAEDGRLRHRP